LVGEVELDDCGVAADLRRTLRAQLQVAHSQNHVRTGAGQRSRRPQAHTVGGACDDDALATQIAKSARRPV
jgi:hypothetical protein